MIADVFIKRPVTAIVISVVIVLVGLISMSVLPVAQYPDITPPTVSIVGLFTGADAQTTRQSVKLLDAAQTTNKQLSQQVDSLSGEVQQTKAALVPIPVVTPPVLSGPLKK